MTVTATAPVQAARNGRSSVRSRRLVGLVLLLLLVGAAAVASIAVGTRSMGLGEVWRALFDAGLSTEEAVIVRELRVPRTALGLMVGMSLGIAGALMQGHTRNPLGDPGLLGVQRPRLTEALDRLRKRGISTPERGMIVVSNRELLERSACSCYRLLRTYASGIVDAEPRRPEPAPASLG